MEVKLAKTAGFCFGVRRAVDHLGELVRAGGQDIYTFGPIIHNEQVVEEFRRKGVKVLNNVQELRELDHGCVVIRSHGVPRAVQDLIYEKKLHCVDMTCPYVKKIHRIAERETHAGRHMVIIGDPTHPEVEGIMGWCETPASVLKSHEDAEKFLEADEKAICVVSQTTFNYNKFQELVEILNKKRYDKVVFNTICSATEERQSEARDMAKVVDAMIVIGGSHSSNTQKLYEICKKECKNTYYIQSLVDLDFEAFQSIDCVGITAGASTPNNIIEEVQKHVGIKF